MKLRIAEQYVEKFGLLAKEGNTFVLPANLGDVGSMVAMAQGMLGGRKSAERRSASPPSSILEAQRTSIA